ncbi:MAG: DUF4296 domain-containing protein [Chitinophagales bacterium]|nr:DUF4296 domain-containing protein [Chitinophagales bacterium]
MRNSNWHLFIAALLVCFFSACVAHPEKVPSGILPEDKMIHILLDVHIAESSVNSRGMTNQQLNQLVAAKYDTVMKKNGTTFRIFEESFNYYLRHPEQFEMIYQEIVNQLTALEGKSKAKQAPMRKEGIDSLGTHAR